MIRDLAVLVVLLALANLSLAFPAFGAEPVYLDAPPVNANKTTGLLISNRIEFNPSRNESLPIPFAVSGKSTVTLTLYSPDGDIVRQLLSNVPYDTGEHTVPWDGLDDNGLVVPDEAYSPVLSLVTDSARVIDDARRYSGGEIIPNIDWQTDNNATISFQLAYPARVLVRTGVKDGPMMRVLKYWQPTQPGKTVIRWNGRDKDGVEAFGERDDTWFVVMAYRLPMYSLVTTGNNAMEYLEYRKKRGWSNPKANLGAIELQRNGVRLEQDYFLPRSYNPEVILNIAEGGQPSRLEIPIVEDTIRFKIDVPEEDRWILDTTFYETSLYIDYLFHSEEEQGFVPMVWEFDTQGLKPGRHIATVQLFGFGGFISSDTVEFLVKP